MNRLVAILLTALLLIVLTAPATAQDRPRSDTGRSREQTPPSPIVVEETDATAPDKGREGSFFLVFGGGLTGGTDLFRAETVSGDPVHWPGSPFSTERFNAKVSSGLTLGMGAGWRLGEMFNLRLDLSWGEMDVTAESTVDQVGDVFTYDRLGVLEVVLGGEVRLARQPSAPYLGLGLVMQGIAASTADDLDQTGIGGRATMGYRHVVADIWSLRVEGRLTYAPFDASGHAPVTEPPTEILITSESSHTLWQLFLGLQMEI